MLNERYTLWRNGKGQPVEKPLSEMTAGEVLQAIRHALDEDRRLYALCGVDWPLHELLDRGEPPPPEISSEQIQAAAQRARAAAAASVKGADLLQQVRAAIPQWQRYPSLGLSAAVRRFWPR